MRVFLIILLLAIPISALAQAFGQNKPRYAQFDFEVYRSPHFDIYHYFKDSALRDQLTKNAEQWYLMHQAVMKDTFHHHNPIIIYGSHPDFQQTSAISGSIGEGTGGVTESLKNRVIFPVMFSNQQTGHVLGHELVHAFQYHLVLTFNQKELERQREAKERLHESQKRKKRKKDKKKEISKSDTILVSAVDTIALLMHFRNLPLWMVEGMAEYLSIGRKDPNTSLWMRDAVVSGNLPAIEDLYNSSKYFPYRWGHAFWAFIVGQYGEEMLLKLFIQTGQYGLEKAILLNTGMEIEAFSNMWKDHLNHYYGSGQRMTEPDPIKHPLLIGSEAGGRANIGPSISPNGRYMVFVSEKNIFSMELYLGDAQTGKMIKKITSFNRNEHLDNIESIETTATWSPDNRHIAYVGLSKGKNLLIVEDVFSRRKPREYLLPDVPAFTTPKWSPDGNHVVVIGLVDGQTDLFVIDLNTEHVRQITDDSFSEILPAWSPDGKALVYSSDRRSFSAGKIPGNLTYGLEILNLESGQVTEVPVFNSGDQVNGSFDPDNQGIWFLSNHDGYRDLYFHDLKTKETYRETNFRTGITGITPLAPAFSVAKDGTILYSKFENNEYNIYLGSRDTFLHEKIPGPAVESYADLLSEDPVDAITKTIQEMEQIQPDSLEHNRNVEYVPQFKLDYIGGQAGVSIATSSFGTSSGLNGGVNMLFSDILGHQKLFVGTALSGQIQDFTAMATFINQEKRLPWAVGVSHIPYLSGGIRYLGTELVRLDEDTLLTTHYAFDQHRTFQEQISTSIHYPLNVSKRFELSGSVAFYHYSLKRYHVYYFGPVPIARYEEKPPAMKGEFIENASIAFVHDNSRFGITAPSIGKRYRLEVGKYFGGLDFITLLVDYRKYWFLKPITFAARGMHFGRYGSSERLNPIFIGYPGFVRGYSFNQFLSHFQNDLYFAIDQLTGSKIAITSFEVRLPFTGPEVLSLIPSNMWYSDLAIFFDSGVAWNDFEQFRNNNGEDTANEIQTDPLFIHSLGVSYRINLANTAILEFYYAFPLHQDFTPGLGVNIIPGW